MKDVVLNLEIKDEIQEALKHFGQQALAPVQDPRDRPTYGKILGSLSSLNTILLRQEQADSPGERVSLLVDAQAALEDLEKSFECLWGGERQSYLELVRQWRKQIAEAVQAVMRWIQNPFYYGQAIREPESFFGRKREVQEIYHSILSGADCAIVGERRVGKSSLLRHITHPKIEARNGLDFRRLVFARLDCQGFPSATPVDLWGTILAELERSLSGQMGLQIQILETRKQEQIDNYQLLQLFRQVNATAGKVALLFDEFEAVTANPNLDQTFFGGLRFLSHEAQINYVITIQRPLIELQSAYPATMTSPFFNTFHRVNLGPFTPSEAEDLLTRSLQGTGIQFTGQDRQFLEDVAGWHPFFLQMAAYHLFAAYTNKYLRREVAYYPWVLERLRDNSAEHWRYYWDHSDNGEKLILAILSLVETGKIQHHKLDRHFDAGMLRRLGERSLLHERQGQPTVFSNLFTAWIVEELSYIATDQVEDFDRIVAEIKGKSVRDRWIDTTERIRRGFARIDVPAMIAWLLEDDRAGTIVDLLSSLLQFKPPGP